MFINYIVIAISLLSIHLLEKTHTDRSLYSNFGFEPDTLMVSNQELHIRWQKDLEVINEIVILDENGNPIRRITNGS